MREMNITVLIEYFNGSIEYRTFNGTVGTVAAFKRRLVARLIRPNVRRIACGNALITFHYGAH